MLLALLILFALLYFIGLSAYLCLFVVGGTGSYGAYKLFALSHQHGPHGIMKLAASKRTPKFIKSYTRKIFY
jgi:hypothetical protein